MELQEILSKGDHTLLAQSAAWEDIRGICDAGLAYGTASVCIPPSYVARAREYLGDRLAVCTVIGFPNGYATTAAKCFEAAGAVEDGAEEIDMVINIGWAKDGRWENLLQQIRAGRDACGDKILKGSVETCLLTAAGNIHQCAIASESGAAQSQP